MKNTKIQITLVIRPEPGSNDVDGVIFQNTTTANGNTEKWMDDTVGAIKRLVLDHINKGENTLAEEKRMIRPLRVPLRMMRTKSRKRKKQRKKEGMQ